MLDEPWPSFARVVVMRDPGASFSKYPRYTCWFGFDGATITPNRDEILGRELYDHRGDPGELDWRGEHVNLAGKPEHGATVASLHKMALDYIQLYPVGRAHMVHKSGVVCNFESELLFCL